MRELRIAAANKLGNLPYPVGKFLFHLVIPHSECPHCGMSQCGVTILSCKDMEKLFKR